MSTLARCRALFGQIKRLSLSRWKNLCAKNFTTSSLRQQYEIDRTIKSHFDDNENLLDKRINDLRYFYDLENNHYTVFTDAGSYLESGQPDKVGIGVYSPGYGDVRSIFFSKRIHDSTSMDLAELQAIYEGVSRFSSAARNAENLDSRKKVYIFSDNEHAIQRLDNYKNGERGNDEFQPFLKAINEESQTLYTDKKVDIMISYIPAHFSVPMNYQAYKFAASGVGTTHGTRNRQLPEINTYWFIVALYWNLFGGKGYLDIDFKPLELITDFPEKRGMIAMLEHLQHNYHDAHFVFSVVQQHLRNENKNAYALAAHCPHLLEIENRMVVRGNELLQLDKKWSQSNALVLAMQSIYEKRRNMKVHRRHVVLVTNDQEAFKSTAADDEEVDMGMVYRMNLRTYLAKLASDLRNEDIRVTLMFAPYDYGIEGHRTADDLAWIGARLNNVGDVALESRFPDGYLQNKEVAKLHWDKRLEWLLKIKEDLAKRSE